MRDPSGVCHCGLCGPADWWLPSLGTPRYDAIAHDPLRTAKDRVTWADYQAMLAAGVPSRALVGPQGIAFGVATIQGRQMLVTDDRRLRSYIDGPVMAAMPDAGGGATSDNQ